MANDLQDINSTSQVVSTNIQCMCRAHETSISAKICLTAAGIQDGKCLVHHPRFIDVVEGCNDCTAAYTNKSTFNNLLIYATNLDKKRDCLHKHVNMSKMPPTTINGVMRCNWAHIFLDETPTSLNKRTTVINLAPPSHQRREASMTACAAERNMRSPKPSLSR